MFELRPDGGARLVVPGADAIVDVVVGLFGSADGGPSTTLYVGRIVINVAPDGVWSVEPGAGSTMDVCTALS